MLFMNELIDKEYSGNLAYYLHIKKWKDFIQTKDLKRGPVHSRIKKKGVDR